MKTTSSPYLGSLRSSARKSHAKYGSVGAGSDASTKVSLCDSEQHSSQRNLSHSLLQSYTSLKDEASRIAFLDSTRSHHHPHVKMLTSEGEYDTNPSDSLRHYPTEPAYMPLPTPPQAQNEDAENLSNVKIKSFFGLSHPHLRKLALDLSLWVNIFILLTKAVAYVETLSLSILAALVDSVLDVASQWILSYTEHRSSKSRSSAHYPAGAARLEPLGVLSCAALMGFASFGVLKEASETLYVGLWVERGGENGGANFIQDENWSSFWSMFGVVFVKIALWALCVKVGQENDGDNAYLVDSTLEAVAQDHWNDCLSNAVAAVALLFVLSNKHLWILDPIGAVIISMYIINSWYSTGKEQIEQLTGKAAPSEFIEELHEMANNFDSKMEVDVVRAYHFGPKFLVELEVVLPRDTLLFESHDLGMELQYEIESREEVERCFVHIDYESRPYDEHVVSKVPELRERYRPYNRWSSGVNSV